jgi:EAL domain-containing protein (putative c-di-GMP-specific phosphodiesterase class I)/GGDEF domain-containing protein
MIRRALEPGLPRQLDPGAQVAIGVGYACAAFALLLLTDRPGPASVLWVPAAGLGFGYLAIAGWRAVPAVLAVHLAGQVLLGSGPGNGGGAVHEVAVVAVTALAAVALRRCWRADASFGSLAWFTLFGLVVAPAASAGVGAALARAGVEPAAGSVWWWPILGQATAVATVTPAVLLVTTSVLTGRRLVSRPGRRARVAAAAQAAVIVLAPGAILASGGITAAELPLVPLALAPVVWATLRSDVTRSALALAGGSLVLGAVAHARFGDAPATQRLQTMMLAGALGTLFVGASLDADSRVRRSAEIAATRWRALVDAAPAVVARVSGYGTWRIESGTSVTATHDARVDPEAREVVARARTVPELMQAIGARQPLSVHWSLGSGNSRWFVTQVTPLPDGESLTVTTETTRLTSAESALAWERSHDRDTDLPNRDLLLATAGQTLAEGVPCSLLVLDVDHLTRLAALVDEDPAAVMAHLAERLRSTLNAHLGSDDETVVARIGDNRFGILAPVPPAAARGCADVLIERLHEPLGTDRHRLPVTGWVGVAPVDADHGPAEALRRAGMAAHAAAELGGARVVVFDVLAVDTAADRARLVSEVIGAVDAGELEVFFQPDVHLPDGRLTGVEALVRWRGREGYVATTELFVRLAEESGAVRAIDRWVMEESLRQVGAWRRELGVHDLELGLNVSALSLTDDLPAALLDACERHDVPADRVRLEVTETALADDVEAAGVLQRVRSLGFRIALDDFGTGYATLSRLHRLPVDVIKLDRSFLPPLTRDRASQALVSLVLGLADPLQVEVVAEGVETAEQRDVLVDLGCHRAQGFLFSRPAPALAIRDLLTRRTLVLPDSGPDSVPVAGLPVAPRLPRTAPVP